MRVLLWVLSLAAGGVALYFLGRLLWAYWLPVAVTGFLLVGSVFAAAFVRAYLQAWRRPGLDLVGVAGQWAAAKGLGRLRLMAVIIADALVMASGGWVNGMLHAWRNRRTIIGFGGELQQNVAFSRLGGVVARQAPLTLFMVVCAVTAAALLESSWQHQNWLRLFLIILLLNIALRHFLYTAADESLPTLLRRTAGSPWLTFLLIAFCDGLSYLLLLDALLHWDGPASLPLAPLREIARAFFLGSLMDVAKVFLDGGWPRPDTLVIAGLSALYGAAGLRSVTRLKDFDRTDEDHAAIARTYATLGRYTEALSAIERIRKPFSAARLLRAPIMVGLSRFDQAQADVRAAYGLAGREVTPREAYGGLIMVCAQFRYAAQSYNELLRIGIAAGMPDLYILAALSAFAGSGRGFALPAAMPLFAEPAILSHYPLSGASVLLAARERDRARAALEALQPVRPVEEMIAGCLQASWRASDPTTTLEADRAAFDLWSHEALSAFAKVAPGELDAIEHLAAAAHLVAVLALARLLRSLHEQAWQYLAGEFNRPLAAKLAASDLSAPDVAVIDRVLAEQQRAALASIHGQGR